MTYRILPISILAVVALAGSVSPSQAQCDPDSDVQFVCGPVSPEDMVPITQSPWILVSGMEDDGYLYATDTRDLTSRVLFPTPQARPRHDRMTYGSCPGPVTGGFRPHGLSLRQGDTNTHTLCGPPRRARSDRGLYRRCRRSVTRRGPTRPRLDRMCGSAGGREHELGRSTARRRICRHELPDSIR
jgi:hypothetical protein